MRKVAIITPVFNAARFVEETIQSVFAQTFSDWTLVLVDDGSTDESLAICHKFTPDPRVIVIAQENRGVATARNHGIAMAGESEYITFLDSDDLLESTFLERAIGLMDRDPMLCLLRTRFHRIRESGGQWSKIAEFRMWNHEKLCWKLFDASLAKLFLLLGTFPPVGVLLRRLAIHEEAWFNESLFGTEDSELWTRLALREKRMKLTNFIGGQYRIRSSSISTNCEVRSINYKKWINCSLELPESKKYIEYISVLSSALREIRISNGMASCEREAQAELGASMLLKCIGQISDIPTRHLIFCSIINAPLINRQSWLKKMGARIETQICGELMGLFKQGNQIAALGRFLMISLRRPVSTGIAFLQIFGILTYR